MEARLTTRAKIRHYITVMMIDEVDVGGRVFVNRPGRLLNGELPALCISYGDETVEVISGSRHLPKLYRRDLEISFTIAVEGATGDTLDDDTDGDDYIDWLGESVDRAMARDPRLASRLDGYDADTNYIGLTEGHVLRGVSTYEPDVDGEKRIIAQELRFLIPYVTSARVENRLQDFLEYQAEINGLISEGTIGE